MSGKVLLPKEVAEAIEVLKTTYNYNLYYLIDLAHSPENYEDKAEVYYITIIEAYARDNYESIMRAIISGFEVEKSPKEKVREYYEASVNQANLANVNSLGKALYNGKSSAVIKTLDLLEIKIEGVNE